MALLGLVCVVDLFDLTAVDAQAAWRQDPLCHLPAHVPKPRLGRLLWLQEERQVEHLGQDKQALGKAESIGVQLGRRRRFRQQDTHGVMSQEDAVEPPFAPPQASWSVRQGNGRARAF